MLDRQTATIKRAQELTREAEHNYDGPKLTMREARQLENLPSTTTMPQQGNASVNRVHERNPSYESLMDDVFAEINKEAGQCN